MEKILLSNIFKKSENQKSFVLETALVFRLKLETLFQIYDIEKIYGVSTSEELYKKLIDENFWIDFSLNYLFFNDQTDQNLALTEFYNYYNKLMIALRMNKTVFKEYLDFLSDKGINAIKKKDNLDLTYPDYLEILNYQLKYAIPSIAIEKEFGICRSVYQKKVSKLIEQNPELYEKYHSLMDFGHDTFMTKRG